jgi:hypothetical protein
MSKKPRWESELEFNKFLVREYLRYGSVDEVVKRHNHDIPISYANHHRILDKWGIVKAAGPNSKLNESLEFLYHLTETNIPFERLYSKMPTSFKTSAVTLYRVLSYIKEGITRRVGTGLIITPYNSQHKVLVGQDKSTPRVELGKPFGAISIPIGFSRKRDSREDAILRILQQEVFTKKAIEREMPDVIPAKPKPFIQTSRRPRTFSSRTNGSSEQTFRRKLGVLYPRLFMYLDIADVRVEVFHMKLPKKLSDPKCFSSFKLQNHKFMSINTILKVDTRTRKFRAGVVAGISGYKKYLELQKRNLDTNPLYIRSKLNYQLSTGD